VTTVTWSNAATGGSGTATGTTYWETASIPLDVGSNLITVTAHDSSGNSETETINVTYTPTDTTDPEIAITEPTTGSTYDTDDSSLSISGTSSDDTGVTSITWSNSRGGTGTATFEGGAWEIDSIPLQEGNNVITVTASDGSGNSATATITVNYSPEASGGSDGMDTWVLILGIAGVVIVIALVLFFVMKKKKGGNAGEKKD
jgi:hypothetical protein